MNIEKQIEFNQVREKWIEFAITDNAKDEIKATEICLDETDLRRRLRETSEGKELMEKLGMPPLQNVSEIKEIVTLAEKGSCLTPYQLERVEKVLIIMSRLKDYLKRGIAFGIPLAYYEEQLYERNDLREEIRKQIRNGEVDDYASKELGQIRNQIAKCEEEMKRKAEQIMRAHKECMADSFCTYRNGRLCVPVKKEYKFKISGSTIDKSSTGNTLFIEPTSVAKFYEEIQLLRIDEENEIYRILYTLTAMVAEASFELNENVAMIEKLDFIFSKGKLSIDLVATEPKINTQRRIVYNLKLEKMQGELLLQVQILVGRPLQSKQLC